MEWKDLPEEIQNVMLKRQYEQTGTTNVAVFEKKIFSGKLNGGFDWDQSTEGRDFWNKILREGKIEHFYTVYPKYPKVMRVSNIPINGGNKGELRVVFMEKCGKFVAWVNAETIEDAEEETDSCGWEYAKDVEEEAPIRELSMDEIAEQFGLKVKQIRIRKD